MYDTVRLEIAELLHRPLATLRTVDIQRISALRQIDPSSSTAAVLDLICRYAA